MSLDATNCQEVLLNPSGEIAFVGSNETLANSLMHFSKRFSAHQFFSGDEATFTFSSKTVPNATNIKLNVSFNTKTCISAWLKCYEQLNHKTDINPALFQHIHNLFLLELALQTQTLPVDDALKLFQSYQQQPKATSFIGQTKLYLLKTDRIFISGDSP